MIEHSCRSRMKRRKEWNSLLWEFEAVEMSRSGKFRKWLWIPKFEIKSLSAPEILYLRPSSSIRTNRCAIQQRLEINSRSLKFSYVPKIVNRLWISSNTKFVLVSVISAYSGSSSMYSTALSFLWKLGLLTCWRCTVSLHACVHWARLKCRTYKIVCAHTFAVHDDGQ